MHDPTLPAASSTAPPTTATASARDITLDEISDVLARRRRQLRLGRPVRTGRRAARQAAGGVRPARPRGRGRAATRTSARRSRPTAIRCSSRCTPRRWSTSHIRFGETTCFLGPRYLVTVRHGASLSLRAGARALRARTRDCCALGPTYGAVRGARLRRRQLPADRRRVPAMTLNALEQDIFAETFRRDTIVKLYDLKRELTQLRLAVVADAGHPRRSSRASHGALVPDEVRAVLPRRARPRVRVNETTDTMREMLTAAMSVNLSLVTVAPGRGGQAPRRLGRAARRADPDRELVRHELRRTCRNCTAATATRS